MLVGKPGSAVPYQDNTGRVSIGPFLIEILMVAIAAWFFCSFALIPFFDWIAEPIAEFLGWVAEWSGIS